jgi:hypothetical protein
MAGTFTGPPSPWRTVARARLYLATPTDSMPLARVPRSRKRARHTPQRQNCPLREMILLGANTTDIELFSE